jgi:HJR/Mrr/RecB family endonuclease
VSIVGKSYLISLVRGNSDLLRIPEQLANDLGTKDTIETTAQKPDGRKLPIRLNLNDRIIMGLGPWIRTCDDENMRSVRLTVLSERPYTFSVEFSDQAPPPRNPAENSKISRPDKGLFLGSKIMPEFFELVRTAEAVAVEETDLLKQVFICGAVGSGKTVLAKIFIEEAALKGIPVIAIDLKGDISSMAIMFSGEDPTELIPWISPQRDEDRETIAANQAQEHKANLLRWGLSYRDVEDFRKKVAVNVFTPRSNAGFRLALSAFVEPPEDLEKLKEKDPDSFDEIIEFMAKTFISRLTLTKKKADKARGYVYEIIKAFWNRGESLRGYNGIKQVLDEVMSGHLGIDQIGGMDTNEFISQKDRDEISPSINTLLIGAQKLWFQGFPLNIDELINPDNYDGKTPIAIINIKHLNFQDQAYVVGYVAYLVWFWMRCQKGSEKPKLLFYIDEIGGGGSKEALFHSVAISPCKPALNLLLRQGRGFGVCCMFATQCPNDIDFKALGQCGTWAVGQLRMKRERQKIEEGASIAELDFKTASEHLPNFKTGQFLLKTPSLEWTVFEERWLMHLHRVLSQEDLEQLKENYEKEVSVLFQEVEKLLQANKLSSAKNILESIINRYRFSARCAMAYLKLGNLLYEMSDYESAIKILDEMVKNRMEAEEIGQAYFLLGKCKEQQGYFDDAAKEFAKVANSAASEEIKESALKHEQYCKNRAAWPELTAVQKFFWWIIGKKPESSVLVRIQTKDKELLDEEFRASLQKEDFEIPEAIDFQSLIDAQKKAEAEQKEKEAEQIKAEHEAQHQVPKIEAYLQKGALTEAFQSCRRIIQRIQEVEGFASDSVISIIKKCNEHRDEKEQGLNKRVLMLPARQFEFEIANLFRCKGYKSLATQFTNDDGVDVLASNDQEKIIIQCKRWTHPVGRAVVDELAGVQKRYGANRAILAATSTFTDGAKDAAHKHNIELWDFYKIRLEWQQALNVE